MTNDDPISLLFGGMEKLGPGDDAQTLHVLGRLPSREFRVVVDAGCGTGRQTLVLARALGTRVHAIDSYAPFLDDLLRRAEQAGLREWVETHCLDMKDIPKVFPAIDLLWSEGAAYSIGFANALSLWGPALVPGGFVVVSELCWLAEAKAPPAARDFFRSIYPDMLSVEDNVQRIASLGFEILSTHTLPREAWVEGYYDVLGPRAKALLDHPAPAVRDLAAETIQEIEVFERSADSYAYVFFLLRHGPAKPSEE